MNSNLFKSFKKDDDIPHSADSAMGNSVPLKGENPRMMFFSFIDSYTVDDLWQAIANKLELVLIDPKINLYENSEGKFVLSKYGFIKQTYTTIEKDKFDEAKKKQYMDEKGLDIGFKS